MTLLLAVIAVSATAPVNAHGSTPQEEAFCSGSKSDQPYRFCLADRKHERAERQLTTVLVKARRAARAQKQEISDFTKKVGGVTLSGDPVLALDASQRAWERSYKADCEVAGLAVATGNGGTEGVSEAWGCEADRMLDRAEFLVRVYSIKG